MQLSVAYAEDTGAISDYHVVICTYLNQQGPRTPEDRCSTLVVDVHVPNRREAIRRALFGSTTVRRRVFLSENIFGVRHIIESSLIRVVDTATPRTSIRVLLVNAIEQEPEGWWFQPQDFRTQLREFAVGLAESLPETERPTEQPRVGRSTCKHCGATGLRWQPVSRFNRQKWILTADGEGVHNCEGYRNFLQSYLTPQQFNGLSVRVRPVPEQEQTT